MFGTARHESMMQRLFLGRMFAGRFLPEGLRTETGGRIDRKADLRFNFDGDTLLACRGDTLASALLANGVHVVGRSMKYHRPRGILSAGAEEPNALVTLRRHDGRETPNLRATQVEVYEGLAATSQNRWPNLDMDLGALAGRASALMPPGFYYKTFMGPRGLGLWHRLFEPAIRRAAGLGRAPAAADPDRYARFYEHCDVLVVGAGPAGLAAALAAGEAGARVILCDEQAEPGGSLLAETRATIDGAPAQAWLADALGRLAALGVRVMARTTAFGMYPHNMVGLAERVTDHLAAPDPDLPRERLWQVRARHVVLAAGAIEQPLLFPDNDRPGVMLAEAGRTYLARYGVKVGDQVVVAAADDGPYRAAIELAEAGVTVKLVVDLRPRADGPWPQAARAAGIGVLEGATIGGTWTRRHRVVAAQVRRVDRRERWFDCDALLMGNGFVPSVHLFAQARGTLRHDAARGIFLPGEAPEALRAVGACNGAVGLDAALAEGAAAGHAAVRLPGEPRVPVVGGTLPVVSSRAIAMSPPKGKAFVDFQNDVLAGDIGLAVAEGMRSIEHVKRFTTAGLGTDQGKTGNMAAIDLAAAARGAAVPEVGTTTFRPPYTPVTFGTLAGPARGELFDPVRTTPLHPRAEALGAVFEDVGQWKRARSFPRSREDLHAATTREAATVRAAVGMFDASTLGKIEVVGPDAAAFLERIYVNGVAKLPVGRCRYGVMLTEAGFVMDDGIIARLAPGRYHLTTTTGGAARVLHHMEDYLQTEWPHLRVCLTSTTEQWAVIAVQGPRARGVLAPLAEADLSAMPHLSVIDTVIAGAPARLMRVSFTGEAGFEVNVPASQAAQVWDAILPRVQEVSGCVYGTEAMHVLRAEKGFIIVGQETDGTVTPGDLGLGWMIPRAKADFVGKRSLARADMLVPERRQLVGLLTENPATVLEEGAQVTADPRPPAGTRALGHVTSAYHSPALGRAIALALVEGGRARMGETLHVPMPGGPIAVQVAPPCFLDPEGARLHG
jgi:sarcosine oxidase subunit alpha